MPPQCMFVTNGMLTHERSVDGLSISYNGGKDCLVLLILYLAALHRYSQNTTSSQSATLPKTLQSIYIIPPHPFPEVDRFVEYSVRTYTLELARYAVPMKLAFEMYLVERPKVKAVLVGTRRTDPHGGRLGFFNETDHGWPGFMRVHPVIDWRYAEIWAVSLSPPVFFFLRASWIHMSIRGRGNLYAFRYRITKMTGCADLWGNWRGS